MLAQACLLLLLPLLSLAAPAPKQKELYHIRNSEGLYLSPYHTAAGISDAVFVEDIELAAKGYLQDSNQLFEVDSALIWGMILVPQSTGQWASVQMRAEESTPGFSHEGDKLVWNGDERSGAWIVCDWWHGSPQLFWAEDNAKMPNLPTSCSVTELTVEHI